MDNVMPALGIRYASKILTIRHAQIFLLPIDAMFQACTI